MMKSLVSVLAAGAVLFAMPLPLPAQETAPMSLHDCMAFALSHSTRMRIREAERGDARIARRDAVLAAFTPQFSASAYAYYNFGRSIDPQTNTYFTRTSFNNGYGISAGFDLFNGFQAVNNLKISKTGLLIRQSEREQAEADICLAVMEAYYNVVYYRRLAEACREQVTAAEASLRKARRQEELGQKGHADVVQMEADLAERRYDLVNTQNRYADQLMTLSDLMFWPPEQELTVDEEISDEIAEPVNAESVVEYALGNDPKVRTAALVLENARRELSTARWQLLPTAGIYGGWSTNYYTYRGARTDSFSAQFRNNGGEYIQLSLSIPVFGRLSRHSALSRKRNAVVRAEAEYDQCRHDIESEVRRAVQDRDGAWSAYLQAQQKARVQSEAYTLNRRKLEQGLISPLEFQTAGSNYLRSKADLLNSLFLYRIKQAVVRYYNGEDYLRQ